MLTPNQLAIVHLLDAVAWWGVLTPFVLCNVGKAIFAKGTRRWYVLNTIVSLYRPLQGVALIAWVSMSLLGDMFAPGRSAWERLLWGCIDVWIFRSWWRDRNKGSDDDDDIWKRLGKRLRRTLPSPAQPVSNPA